jgi:hypothetical protein
MTQVSEHKVVIGSPNRITIHWSDDPNDAAVIRDLRTKRETQVSLAALIALANREQGYE